MPLSTAPVVQSSALKVAILMKNVAFVALGLVTPLNATVWLPVGAAELVVFFSRNTPVVESVVDHPDASPRLVGWEERVAEAAEKLVGVVHAPLAVVQAVNDADFSTVAEGTVNVKV
jgi:hypothetical protein